MERAQAEEQILELFCLLQSRIVPAGFAQLQVT